MEPTSETMKYNFNVTNLQVIGDRYPFENVHALLVMESVSRELFPDLVWTNDGDSFRMLQEW